MIDYADYHALTFRPNTAPAKSYVCAADERIVHVHDDASGSVYAYRLPAGLADDREGFELWAEMTFCSDHSGAPTVRQIVWLAQDETERPEAE